jgi:drug/metabolite transporter (DMT)-like permease
LTVAVERFAVQLMAGQAALFAAETAIVHHIGSNFSIAQFAFVRSAAGVVLALVLAHNVGLRVMQSRQLPLQLLRGVISLLYLWVMIYSFSHLPFADATAISYTQAAYITAFSVLILGEPVSRGCWAAAGLGIFGALLITKPAVGGWHAAHLIVLLGTSLNGLSFVLNRYLQRQDSEATTMFYTNLVPALASAPAFLIAGLPAPDMLGWLSGLIFLGPVGVYLGIIAAKRANTAILGPFTLLRLVIAVFVGAAVFQELPDLVTVWGITLILASCFMSAPIGSSVLRFVMRFSSVLARWWLAVTGYRLLRDWIATPPKRI